MTLHIAVFGAEGILRFAQLALTANSPLFLVLSWSISYALHHFHFCVGVSFSNFVSHCPPWFPTPPLRLYPPSFVLLLLFWTDTKNVKCPVMNGEARYRKGKLWPRGPYFPLLVETSLCLVKLLITARVCSSVGSRGKCDNCDQKSISIYLRNFALRGFKESKNWFSTSRPSIVVIVCWWFCRLYNKHTSGNIQIAMDG